MGELFKLYQCDIGKSESSIYFYCITDNGSNLLMHYNYLCIELNAMDLI